MKKLDKIKVLTGELGAPIQVDTEKRCKDYLGTYECCEVLNLPWNNKKVDIDRCLVQEILWLWKQGIKTIECCCGHGVGNGYIAVEDESVEKMKKINYIKHLNINYKDSDNFFVPKSLLKTEEVEENKNEYIDPKIQRNFETLRNNDDFYLIARTYDMPKE